MAEREGPLPDIVMAVPEIEQRTLWCGYASTAMLLQHERYPIDPNDLYRHFNDGEEYDPRTDTNLLRKPLPGARGLIKSAEGAMAEYHERNPQSTLPDLTGGFVNREVFDRMSREPIPFLQGMLSIGRPLMLRTPGHWVVASGIHPAAEEYTIIDPRPGIGKKRIGMNFLHNLWEGGEVSSLSLGGGTLLDPSYLAVYFKKPKLQPK